MARIPYINRMEMCGNLGNDPTLRYLPNGDAVLSLRLAVQESWKDANENWQKHTEWTTVVMYRAVAERAADYRKGDTIYVVGRKHTREWTDDKQAKRTSLELIAEDHHQVVIPRENAQQSAPPASPAQQGKPARTERVEEPAPPPTSFDGPDALRKMA